MRIISFSLFSISRDRLLWLFLEAASAGVDCSRRADFVRSIDEPAAVVLIDFLRWRAWCRYASWCRWCRPLINIDGREPMPWLMPWLAVPLHWWCRLRRLWCRHFSKMCFDCWYFADISLPADDVAVMWLFSLLHVTLIDVPMTFVITPQHLPMKITPPWLRFLLLDDESTLMKMSYDWCIDYRHFDVTFDYFGKIIFFQPYADHMIIFFAIFFSHYALLRCVIDYWWWWCSRWPDFNISADDVTFLGQISIIVTTFRREGPKHFFLFDYWCIDVRPWGLSISHAVITIFSMIIFDVAAVVSHFRDWCKHWCEEISLM